MGAKHGGERSDKFVRFSNQRFTNCFLAIDIFFSIFEKVGIKSALRRIRRLRKNQKKKMKKQTKMNEI